MGEGAEAALALDDGEGDAHLAAEGGEPHNQLNRINVVSDEDQLGLLLLNEGGDVLQAVLEDNGGSAGLVLGGGGGLNTLLLLLSGLGLVLQEELESLGSLVLVQSLGELVDHWGDLEALQQDLLLALQTNVLGPSDIAREIAASGADVATNTSVLGAGGEQSGGLLGFLGGLLGNLLVSLGRLLIERKNKMDIRIEKHK